MKKLILGTILILLSQTIFGMEKSNENQFNILSELGKHLPELERKIRVFQMDVIEREIISILKSNTDVAKAVVDAFKYVNNIASIDKIWYSKKAELIDLVKTLAKKELAPQYANLNQEELNYILNTVVIYLFKNAEDSGIKFDDIRQDMLENPESLRNDFVKLIIAGASPNFEIIEKMGEIPAHQSLLQLMIELEDVNFVLLLLLYGANANHKNSLEHSPLVSAILRYYFSSDKEKIRRIIKLLILFGADVNERSKNGANIPIYWAIMRKEVTILELLLQDGAKLNEEELGRIKEVRTRYKPKIYENFVEILKKYGYQI